jgi:hypothetical protein
VIKTGPLLAALFALLVCWLNSRLDSFVIGIFPTFNVATLLHYTTKQNYPGSDMPVSRSVTQYESSGVHALLGILSKRIWSGSSQPTGFHPPRQSKYIHCFGVPLGNQLPDVALLFPCSIFTFCSGFCSKMCYLESRSTMFAGQRNRKSL